MGPEPIDAPMTALLEGVIGLHEIFLTLQRGGFTESQAMQLVVALLQLNGGLPNG